MDAKLAAIFRPGVLPHEGAGDCPRERLIIAKRVEGDIWNGGKVVDCRMWIDERVYRDLSKAGVRMVVLGYCLSLKIIEGARN